MEREEDTSSKQSEQVGSDETTELNDKSTKNNNDYFSLHKINTVYPIHNSLSLSSALSASSESNLSTEQILLPKFASVRSPTNLNFYLSPVVTSPFETLKEESYSAEFLKAAASNTDHLIEPSYPSILYDLEKTAYNVRKDKNIHNYSSILPHDYLNISLADENLKLNQDDILSYIINEYTLLDKLYGEDYSDVIYSYIVEHKITKKRNVIRFSCSLSIGVLARFTNSYHLSSNHNSRLVKNGFPFLIESIKWNYTPRTFPSDTPHIFHCEKLELFNNHNSIIAYYPIEDDFIPLNKFKIQMNSENILKVIKITINLFKALKNIHQYGITINSLTQTNIFINPKTLDVSLMEFDFSFSSFQEQLATPYRRANKSQTLNYLPYTAPENFLELSPVDFRADFYSIGAIIYTFLTGKVHKFNNILNSIVSLLTLSKQQLHEINPLIPVEFSKIILKLTSIDPDARYSSLDFIINDLCTLYTQLTSTIIEHDSITKSLKRIPIVTPFKIVGRNSVTSFLTSQFSKNSVKTFTLIGDTGIGKTAILNSLRLPTLIKKSFFTLWECQDLTYFDSKFETFDLILSALIRDILVMDKNEIMFWRDILTGINADLSVLFRTVPELKILLGGKYKHIKRSKFDKMLQKQNLSHQYILRCVFELFSKHAGWVLVIENIQELSETEASLLKELYHHLKNEFSDGELNFMLLTSFSTTNTQDFQDNERVPSFLKENVIQIDPLTFEETQKVVMNSLYLYDSQFLWKKVDGKESKYYHELDVSPKMSCSRRNMVESIHAYSKGIPLVIKEIITQIHFVQLESKEAVDPVDVYQRFIQKSHPISLTGNFKLDSIYDSVAAYDPKSIQILKYASCIASGLSFNIYDLSIVSNMDVSELYPVLFTGTITSVLTFSSPVSKLPVHLINDKDLLLGQLSFSEKKKLLKCTRFKFIHQTILNNFVESMKKNNEFEETHRLCGLRIDKYLKSLIKDNKLSLSNYDCYLVAYHFMNSYNVCRAEEYAIYSKMLITAAWCAYSSYEHTTALNFFRTAQAMTTDPSIFKGLKWIEIHIYGLKQQHQKCIDLADEALERYKNPEDVAQFMIARMQSLRSLEKWEEAYDACFDILEVLGFELDLRNMSEEDIVQYTETVLKPKLPSSISEIRNLRKLPNVTNLKVLLTQMALVELNQFSVYLGKPYLLPFCNLLNFSLFMEHGKSFYCCLSLIIIASIDALSNAKGLKRAQEYCKLGFNMTKSNSFEANELFLISFRWYCSLIGSLIEPVVKISHSFDISVTNSKIQLLESTFTKAIILKFKLHIWITQGLTLPKLKERMFVLKTTFQPKNDKVQIYDKVYEAVVGILNIITGELRYEDYIKNFDHLDDNTFKSFHISLIYNTNKAFACYVLKKYEQGANIAINKILPGCLNELVSIEITWARYVSVILCYKDRIRRIEQNELQDQETVDKIDKMMSDVLIFFEELSTLNPSVFLCMYHSVDALYKVMNDKNFSQIDILSSFETAIEVCSNYQNYFFESVIAEECARWLTKVSSQSRLPNKYFKLAYNAYHTWGLIQKTQQLEAELGSIVDSSLDLQSQFKLSQKSTNSEIVFKDKYAYLNSMKHQSSVASMDLSLSQNSERRLTPSIVSASLNVGDDIKSDFSKTSDSKGYSSTSKSEVDSTEMSSSLHLAKSVNGEEKYYEESADTMDEEWDRDVIMDLSIKISQSNNVEDLFKTLLVFSLHFIDGEYGCIILNSDDGTPFIKAICLQNYEVRFLEREILSLREDLAPSYLIKDCMTKDTSIWRDSDKFYFDTTYRARESYFENNDCENVICIPIRGGESRVIGALYLENQRRSVFVQSKKIELLEYISLQTYISISKVMMFEKLEIAKHLAEEATADKASFLANMSHEIRTPFNSLMSCAIFLLDTKLTKSQRMYVETIKNSALVTLNIIDGILSFSKLEHGSLTLTYEPFDINLCIEESIQLVIEQTFSKNVEIVFLDNASPFNIVYGDRTRIIQIIINLLGNATKFTDKGYILISSNVSKVSDSRFEFKVIVEDTGIGIAKGNKSKIFQLFNQLDGSSKREHGGSGLGLTISKKIAELMGGDLDYDSEENVGTKFYFKFVTKGESSEERNKCIPGIKDYKIKIFDNRKLSTKALVNKIIKFGGIDENIKTYENVENISSIDEEDRETTNIVFVNSESIKNEDEMKKFRSFFENSRIVYAIAYGINIPSYIEDDNEDNEDNKDDDNKDDNVAKTSSSQDISLVNDILLTPFKSEKVFEILKSGKEIRKIDKKNKKDKIEPSKLNMDLEKEKSSRQNSSGGDKIKLADNCPLKILIAEDNPINTKVVKLQLKRLGYTSDHAKDGVEVIEMIASKEAKNEEMYDLVLMDLQMPRKDGFEASADIRAKYGESIRIVALSANVYAEEKNRCVDIGMNGFLNKPLLPEALICQLESTYSWKIDNM